MGATGTVAALVAGRAVSTAVVRLCWPYSSDDLAGFVLLRSGILFVGDVGEKDGKSKVGDGTITSRAGLRELTVDADSRSAGLDTWR